MAVLFPLDDNGQPIPVLGFDYRGTQKLAVGTGASKVATIPDDIEIVTLIATGLCRFEVGDQTADPAKSPVLFPNQYLDVPLPRGQRRIAFLAEGAPCDVYVIGRV